MPSTNASLLTSTLAVLLISQILQIYGQGLIPTKSGAHHECYRDCNGTPMTCVYNFTVTKKTSMSLECGNCPINITDCNNYGCIPGGGNVRTLFAVNQMAPGPAILVCENDRVIVNVYNGLSTASLSIHWHGIHQNTTPFSDGLPFVNQLPLWPGGFFKYDWIAAPHGTHMWHGHSGYQESDGLYGILNVRRKEPEVVRALYDFDLPEHSSVVWHWYDQPAQDILLPILQRNESINGYGFLINGKETFRKYYTTDASGKNVSVTTEREIFNVTSGYRYRFRVAYNSAIYCPLQISIDDHNLTMISSDTSPFKPVEVQSFMIVNGERYDFVLNASTGHSGCYWMHMKALGDCISKKVHAEAYVCYDGSIPSTTIGSPTYEQGERTGTILNPVELATYNYQNYETVLLTQLEGYDDSLNPQYSGTPNKTLYIQILSKPYTIQEASYPGPWHQLNNVTFKYPGPGLMEYLGTGNMGAGYEALSICTDETRNEFCTGEFCKCLYVEKIPTGSLVEMVLVDITWDRTQDHPMHIHGHSFNIVAQGLLKRNQTVEDIKIMNEAGLIKKRLTQTVVKDTLGVPNRGYSIVRFNANVPGMWVFHCHVTNHMEMGMALILQVGERSEIVQFCETTNKEQCGEWYRSGGSRVTNSILILAIIGFVFCRIFVE